MFSLIVKKELQHPDGRIFTPGHDCHALTIFEVAELVTDYPEHFEAADELTASITVAENMQHYAEAAKRKREEGGS